jgi:hypothetical protein
MQIADVTFSANTAVFMGGAIANGAADATIYAASLTIANNHAQQGGGFYWAGGGHNIINTIFDNNSGGNCNQYPLTGGINISSDDTCFFTGYGSRYNLDPMLGPLQDNGGPTWTQALLAGSPAIDTGTGWLSPLTDQRGVPRPLPGGAGDLVQYDVGAYEVALQVMSGNADAPMVTNTPGRGMFTFEEPGNCRSGPDLIYPVMTSAPAGTIAQVEGRNQDLSWYRIQLANNLCWVSAALGPFDGDPFALPIREAPATPTPTDVPPVICSVYTTQNNCEEHPECYWHMVPDVPRTCKNR